MLTSALRTGEFQQQKLYCRCNTNILCFVVCVGEDTKWNTLHRFKTSGQWFTFHCAFSSHSFVNTTWTDISFKFFRRKNVKTLFYKFMATKCSVGASSALRDHKYVFCYTMHVFSLHGTRYAMIARFKTITILIASTQKVLKRVEWNNKCCICPNVKITYEWKNQLFMKTSNKLEKNDWCVPLHLYN